MFEFGNYLLEVLENVKNTKNVAWVLDGMQIREKQNFSNGIFFYFNGHDIKNTNHRFWQENWVITVIVNNANSQNEAKKIMQEAGIIAESVFEVLGMRLKNMIKIDSNIAGYGILKYVSTDISNYFDSGFLEMRLNFTLDNKC